MSAEESKKQEAKVQIPKWLDKQILEAAFKKDFAIRSLHVDDGIAKGENYNCVIQKATAETSLGTLHLIIKSTPENPIRAYFLKEAQMAAKEIRMYQNTLPLLKGEFEKPLIPMCYQVIDDTLILQDLTFHGYRARKRQLALDYNHCRSALTELAHLHGYSAALRATQPDIYATEKEEFIESIYVDEKLMFMKQMMSGILKNLLEALEKQLPTRFHRLIRIMNFIGQNCLGDIINNLAVDESQKVLVLNHGDFWINNMLFKYKEGTEEPIACALIDFQMPRVASPVLDIFYMMYTSSTQQIRRDHFDDLLNHYMHVTRAAMKQKGVEDCDRYFYSSLDELKADMKRNALPGFIFSSMTLGAAVVDTENAVNMEELDEKSMMDGTAFTKMYSGKLFKERYAAFLEDFDDMGLFLDILKKYPQAAD